MYKQLSLTLEILLERDNLSLSQNKMVATVSLWDGSKNARYLCNRSEILLPYINIAMKKEIRVFNSKKVKLIVKNINFPEDDELSGGVGI